MIRLFLIAGFLISIAGQARADISPSDLTIATFNPEDAVAPASTVEGPGVKIGEGTVLRPVFGLETGLVSNVFYEDANTRGTGLLRLLAQVGTASLGADRLQPTSPTQGDDQAQTNLGSFEYRASLRASYDLMLSNNDAVSSTGGLGLGASIHGLANPMGRLSFGVDEDFTRLIRAANFETDANTNRDINNARLSLLYHPRDRTLGGYLYYNNTVDLFERGDQRFADRMFNRFGLHPTWRWLPQTQVYMDLSWGVVSGLGSSATKVSAYPLDLRAGLGTLLTLNTTLNLEAGYTNGFYSSGPSYSAPVIGANIGYRYSPLGRVTLGYMLMYQDSVNANFYRDHVIRVSAQQLFAPFVLMVQPEVHFRRYEGVTLEVPTVMGPDTRDDLIFAVIAGLHYNLRNRLAATLDYRFSTVQTNYTYMVSGGAADDPSFVRHEILLGMRLAM